MKGMILGRFNQWARRDVGYVRKEEFYTKLCDGLGKDSEAIQHEPGLLRKTHGKKYVDQVMVVKRLQELGDIRRSRAC